MHRIAAAPSPDGCAQPTTGAGPGKIAPIAGIGAAAALGTPLVSHLGGTPVSSTPVPISPIITPGGGGSTPIITPPGGGGGGGTPPTNVPEPTTLVLFLSALVALWLARSFVMRPAPATLMAR